MEGEKEGLCVPRGSEFVLVTINLDSQFGISSG